MIPNAPNPTGMNLGDTRTHTARNHALIAPDSHVVAPLVGWTDTQGVILIAPAMGAGSANANSAGPGFVQYLAHLTPPSVGHPAPAGCQRFVYILEGQANIAGHTLEKDGYAWLPPDHTHDIRGTDGTRLWVHEQRYAPHPTHPAPDAVFGHAKDITAEPFMGDPAARLAKLLPQNDTFDLEVNRFSFDPGAALPLVESHVNEHGLLMIEGAGVYRLGSGDETHWQTVRAGDAIWMGAFCPQWFCCFGKSQATYLYSKNVNRPAI